jgi:hypothetical protein
MRNNLHDCSKNSRIYMGIYTWRVSAEAPCGSAVYICGYWDCMRAWRERGILRERGGGGGAGREKQPLVKTAQKHSVDKHSTPIDPDTTSKKL